GEEEVELGRRAGRELAAEVAGGGDARGVLAEQLLGGGVGLQPQRQFPQVPDHLGGRAVRDAVERQFGVHAVGGGTEHARQQLVQQQSRQRLGGEADRSGSGDPQEGLLRSGQLLARGPPVVVRQLGPEQLHGPQRVSSNAVGVPQRGGQDQWQPGGAQGSDGSAQQSERGSPAGSRVGGQVR